MDDKLNVMEIKLDKAIQGFLERSGYEGYNTELVEIEVSEKIKFIKILHIAYDRAKTETDLNLIDFQQLLSAIASKSKKFVYLIEGSLDGVNLYIGTIEEDENSHFIKDTFEGIYSGSIVSNDEANQPAFDSDMKYSKAMLGIPSLKRDSDKAYKQSLEKILFPLQGKSFRIVLVAESYSSNTVKEIISNYQALGSELHKLVKQCKNLQQSNADSSGITLTDGSSFSETENPTILKDGVEVFKDVSSLLFIGLDSIKENLVEALFGYSKQQKRDHGSFEDKDIIANTLYKVGGRTNLTNESTSKSQNTTKTETIGITFDEINKSAEYCEGLIDKYIERFQKGLNHGMWNASLYIQAEDEIVLSELEHTLKSVYSGDETYYESIRFSDNLSVNENIEISKFPMIYFDKAFVHPIHKSFSGFSSAVNTEELSILAALPNNDIDGLSVSRISSFGLSQSKNIDKYKSIDIGTVLNKKKSTNQKFKLSMDALNSHLFVSGITGGGKSNTIKLILKELQQNENLDRKIPFLVIEPAKSEYKHLLGEIKDLQVFRPGAKDDIFKFNPFVFEHSRKNNNSVSLTKHVDMLKTTFSSAFPMYGPMPYILEEAIHKIYEDKGWNFETEDHRYFTDSSGADYDRKSLLFPNMEDLKNKIESVVNEAGYHQDLQNNIKAALKTRINNLTMGVKGKIFNSRHVFDSKILFEKPTIIELSNIVDDEEKAFLMGLLLNKLYQYREEKGASAELQHITVIEEAHRLLPNISLDRSSEEANSKAKAVETFTNILSEIRAYGEGIIIADQIASKLHRDVIKNTNIKIVHRTMDYEDRELVGKSINLSEEQILDIAELKAGEAIVHNRDIHQAFMVKIDESGFDTDGDIDFEKFNKSFIEGHSDYKYEMIYEEGFYSDENKLVSFKDIDLPSLRITLLKFINSIFFDASNLLDNWREYKKHLSQYAKSDDAIIYISVKAWKELNIISNLQYYNDVDAYLDAYKSLIRLFISLSQEDGEKIEKYTRKFIERFAHENIKVVYPSMRQYEHDAIDYTLLILENITKDEDIYHYVNAVMKEDKILNDRFDKILSKMFNTTNPELRYSLGAIRCGKKEVDLHGIVKQGF